MDKCRLFSGTKKSLCVVGDSGKGEGYQNHRDVGVPGWVSQLSVRLLISAQIVISGS